MPERLCEKSKQIAREPWHRYVLPGYDGGDGFPEYRFDWELFGEAAFYTSVNMSIQAVTFSCFSRAILSDTDLLSLTNEPATTLSSNTDPVLHISESEVKGDEGGYDTDEELAREMAALDLPTSFGGSGREKRRSRCERKHRNYRIREKSPHHESLSDYLFCNGMYLERKSWCHDYPESFSTAQAAENFDEYTDRNYTPYALLKEHDQAIAFFGDSDSKLDHKKGDCSGCWFHLRKSSIKDQIKGSYMDQVECSVKNDEQRYPIDGEDRHWASNDLFKRDHDWNSLYLKHKEAVESRIAKDYEKYSKESHKRRCLEFSDKLALVGLTCKMEDLSNNEDDDDYLETGISGFQRQRGFQIADIHYDFQIPKRIIQKNRRTHPHTNKTANDTNVCFLIWFDEFKEYIINVIMVQQKHFYVISRNLIEVEFHLMDIS
uniref:Inhibitor_I29 domain-containing protein n=1 Tax=Elaeophora elaphi TaxID=1147741 RepID=A0A0R3S579_9BILA